MTQASSNTKNTSSLGAAAAAAATTPAKPADAPKPTDAKPTDGKPADAAAAGATGAATTDDKKKERNGSKIYVAVGAVHEFESINKAEKFLNAEGAPAEYAVLRGKRIGTSKKVSLR